ncbi:MAG: hypothetical protein VR64_21110 [Desulfatitalea sp. BRH_c12]|nr:MAG: hypothetical protein VR64_21110 [Desulfatitalea sp. BRH_c12]
MAKPIKYMCVLLKMVHLTGRPDRFRLLRHFSQTIAILSLFGGQPGFIYNAHAEAPLERKQSMASLERVLLLPSLNMSAIYGENNGLQGPLSGKVFVTGAVSQNATEFLDTALRQKIKQLWAVNLVDPMVDDITSLIGVVPVEGSRGERIAAIQQVGRARGAEAVFCAYVYAFRERVGTAYGVDAPAMVSIELNLVSVASGALLYQHSFTETQKALNEDVLRIDQFLKRKGRWITAEEMAERALEELLKQQDGK